MTVSLRSCLRKISPSDKACASNLRIPLSSRTSVAVTAASCALYRRSRRASQSSRCGNADSGVSRATVASVQRLLFELRLDICDLAVRGLI